MVGMFLFNLLLANILLPSYFGSISLFLLNAGLVSLLTGFGLESYVLHWMTNKRGSIENALSIIWKGFLMQLFIFSCLQLASLLIWKTTLLSQISFGYLLPEYFFFVGLVLSEKYLVLYYALNKSLLVNKLLLLQAAMFLILLFALKNFFKLNYKTVLTIIAMQHLLQGLLFILVFHFSVQKLSFVKTHWRIFTAALSISSVVMITNFVQFLAYRVDFWLLKKYYSAYEVGLYAQANKFANLTWIIPNIFAMLLVPKFSEFSKTEMPGIFKMAFYSNFFISCATLTFSWLLYTYVLNEHYSEGLTSFYIMLPGYFFWALVIYFGAYFSWAGRFKINLVCSVFCFLVIFIFDLILIPRFSINGAALANSFAYLLTLVLYIVLYLKNTTNTLSFTLPRKQDFYTLQKVSNDNK
jgi:O-antigen/teichoic acid export membrane protein